MYGKKQKYYLRFLHGESKEFVVSFIQKSQTPSFKDHEFWTDESMIFERISWFVLQKSLMHDD